MLREFPAVAAAGAAVTAAAAKRKVEAASVVVLPINRCGESAAVDAGPRRNDVAQVLTAALFWEV